MSQPAVAKHLRVLRQADLVQARRDGRHTYYRLKPDGLRVVIDWFAHFEHFWDQKLNALGEYLDKSTEAELEPAKTSKLADIELSQTVTVTESSPISGPKQT